MKTPTNILAAGALAMLAGCASPPPPPPAPPPPADTSRTTVVLLPDEDGNVGMVSVTSATGSQKVDAAYSFTTVAGIAAAPTEARPMDMARVDSAFGSVIKAQPPKPVSFTLYFLLDSAVLTEESKAKLQAVFDAVRERKPTEISIFGHTDAIGKEERNMKLSAERAQAVQNLLRERDPDLGHVDVRYFGSKEPLVPSPARVPEPRNRRAEIMVL